MSILVVDDNEEGREVFEAVLAQGGYEDVITLDSAAAAYSFLKLGTPHVRCSHRVDMILLDIVMPGVDGIEACACIRCDPRYAEVPIVMVTSLEDKESVDSAFKSGATNYITKPLKAVDLWACVRSTLIASERFDRGAVDLLAYIHDDPKPRFRQVR
jgi:sigma-B regulation protein RsbU (phosphoserine phosphatase)